ncbi:MAG: hypothetical protein ABSB35_21845 [Bryobacteraceae bacterium]
MAHKAEHAVDMETGAIVAVTLHGADEGDTKTIQETLAEAGERITSVVADTDNDAVAKQVSAEGPREVVTDKGYHSRAVVSEMTEWGVAHVLFGAGSRTAAVAGSGGRTTRGICQSPGVFAESEAAGCYGNAARSWSDGTNIYTIGGMRRVHLRGRENILKRLVVHSGAANPNKTPFVMTTPQIETRPDRLWVQSASYVTTSGATHTTCRRLSWFDNAYARALRRT